MITSISPRIVLIYWTFSWTFYHPLFDVNRLVESKNKPQKQINQFLVPPKKKKGEREREIDDNIDVDTAHWYKSTSRT